MNWLEKIFCMEKLLCINVEEIDYYFTSYERNACCKEPNVHNGHTH